MARSALNWTVRDLAEHAGLAPNSISAFESGHVVRDVTAARIESTLKKAGIQFIATKGVVGIMAPAP
jgi:transcriptional regulator with XRE-family HTH domain